jgi:hypothetical protein
VSAPLVVNTTDGTCWTRREGSRGGEALYAPEKCGSCPEFVMVTLTELAELGIVGSADVLPVPVGPQMPEFPPPPETELEKLHSERARLQGLLADAVREVHATRRERDLIRERVSEPYGCAYCGAAKRFHGRRYISGAGMHAWERPSDEQVKDRMLARRAARMALPSNLSLWEEGSATAELRARVAELERKKQLADRERVELLAGLERALAPFCGDPKAAADAVAEVRDHDAEWLLRDAQRLQDRVTALETGPALPWAHTMSDDDLPGFLDDLVSAAMGRWRSEPEVPDRTVLADIEKVCADWRTPGQGYRGDEPEAEQSDGLTRLLAPTQVLREDVDESPLRHDYRTSHDMPETGGAT